MPRAVEEIGQRLGIRCQIAHMFLFIGLRRRNGIAHNPADPIREPPLKTNIDRQSGKDRNRHRRYKRQERESPRQTQVKPRSNRLRPPRRDHPRHPLRHERGHREHIDKVEHQNQSERARGRAAVHRPENEEGRKRKARPKQNEPKRRNILHPPLTAQARQTPPMACRCPGAHPTPSNA